MRPMSRGKPRDFPSMTNSFSCSVAIPSRPASSLAPDLPTHPFHPPESMRAGLGEVCLGKARFLFKMVRPAATSGPSALTQACRALQSSVTGRQDGLDCVSPPSAPPGRAWRSEAPAPHLPRPVKPQEFRAGKASSQHSDERADYAHFREASSPYQNCPRHDHGEAGDGAPDSIRPCAFHW